MPKAARRMSGSLTLEACAEQQVIIQQWIGTDEIEAKS